MYIRNYLLHCHRPSILKLMVLQTYSCGALHLLVQGFCVVRSLIFINLYVVIGVICGYRTVISLSIDKYYFASRIYTVWGTLRAIIGSTRYMSHSFCVFFDMRSKCFCFNSPICKFTGLRICFTTDKKIVLGTEKIRKTGVTYMEDCLKLYWGKFSHWHKLIAHKMKRHRKTRAS